MPGIIPSDRPEGARPLTTGQRGAAIGEARSFRTPEGSPREAVAAGEERAFSTLDGLRGIAALAVTGYHLFFISQGQFLGFAKRLRVSFLAVDLFFVLSGFVLAHAYERRLRDDMSLGAFMSLRVQRLGPLYLLSVVLAVGGIALIQLIHPGPDAWSAAALAVTGAAMLVMIPVPSFGFGNTNLYQLNPVIWTLAAEFIVNAAYALLARSLTVARLVAICVVSGLLVVATCWIYGTLGVGAYWSNLWAGLARAFYGFFMGVLMFRLYTLRRPPAVSGWICLALLAIVLVAPLPPSWRAAYEAFCALVVFPALIYVAAGSQLPPIGRRICAVAGTTSYALYVLHFPIGRLIGLAVRQLGWNMKTSAASYGLLVVLVMIAWAADAWFDRPARRAIKRALATRSGGAGSAVAGL